MSREDPLGFLGEEFLTWLWFRIETEGGEFDLGRDRQVAVSFDDFIVFGPRDDDETEQTLRNGIPSQSAEASTALRNGRRLHKARLIIACGDAVYSAVLDGRTMDLLSVKLPEDDPDASSAEERSRDRIQAFLTLRADVARLYREFLQVRLDAGYVAENAPRQATWMASR